MAPPRTESSSSTLEPVCRIASSFSQPYSLGCAGVGESDVGEVLDEWDVELAEAGELGADDVGDFGHVFASS